MAARDLTRGAIPQLVWQLSLPVMATFGLQSLYALADLYFVGLLGGAPLAALSLALNTFFLTLAVGMSLGIGALAVLSRTYGAGGHDRVAELYQQVVWLTLAVGLLAWLAGTLLAGHYIRALSTDETVRTLGTSFFRIFAFTFLAQLMSMVLSFTYRAVGDFITPTVLASVGVVLNLVMDPLLIFGWGPVPALGLNGAAWATAAAHLISAGVMVGLSLRRGGGHPLKLRAPLRVDLAAMLRMLRIGLPSGAQFLIFASMLMVSYRLVRPFGPEATAALGVGFRILETGVLPIVAIGAAVSSLAGQNLGAGQGARARSALHWGLVYAMGFGTVETLLVLWRPAFWVGLFSDDPALIDAGVVYLRMVGPSLLLVAAIHTGSAFAQGLGRTLYPLGGQVIRLASFVGALVLLHGVLQWGLEGIFVSRTLSMLPESVYLVWVLRRLFRGLPGEDAAPASV